MHSEEEQRIIDEINGDYQRGINWWVVVAFTVIIICMLVLIFLPGSNNPNMP